MEANELFAIESHNLHSVQEQMGVAMTPLNRYADELRTAKQKLADRHAAVLSLMGKLTGSKKINEQRAAQFNLTLGQQNKQIKKLGPRLLRRVRVNLQDPGRWEPARSCHGKLSSVRSDHIRKNRYTSDISFPALPLQYISFSVQRWPVC
jgi:hypothetical protein